MFTEELRVQLVQNDKSFDVKIPIVTSKPRFFFIQSFELTGKRTDYKDNYLFIHEELTRGMVFYDTKKEKLEQTDIIAVIPRNITFDDELYMSNDQKPFYIDYTRDLNESPDVSFFQIYNQNADSIRISLKDNNENLFDIKDNYIINIIFAR